MRRVLAGLTVPLLALSVLTACSDDGEPSADAGTEASESPTDAGDEPSEQPDDQPSQGTTAPDPNAPGADSKYCELLGTDFATLFASIQGPEDVDEAVGIIGQIAEEAPSEVKDEWAVMEGAMGQMKTALTKAAELQQKAAEGEVSKEQLQKQTAKLMEDMQALDTPENNQAGQAVSKHAGEYCGIKLGG